MKWKKFLMLDGKKVLSIIILLVLLSVPGFIPPLTNPMLCISGCVLNIGLPLVYFNLEMGETTGMDFNFFNLAIDIMIFYLITSILFYLFRREENVPDSNH